MRTIHEAMRLSFNGYKRFGPIRITETFNDCEEISTALYNDSLRLLCLVFELKFQNFVSELTFSDH